MAIRCSCVSCFTASVSRGSRWRRWLRGLPARPSARPTCRRHSATSRARSPCTARLRSASSTSRPLAGGMARSAARELEERHDARSYSPRYSLVGAIAGASTISMRTSTARSSTSSAGPSAKPPPAAATACSGGRRARRAAGPRAPGGTARRGRARASRSNGRWRGATADGVGSGARPRAGSARASENRWAEGWALHQLGTRQYGLGNGPAAVAGLQQALALRERINDDAGARATRQNLRVAGGPAPAAPPQPSCRWRSSRS